jgi:hypothetical protein
LKGLYNLFFSINKDKDVDRYAAIYSVNVVGNRCSDVDADSYGFSISDVAAFCESMGKHHCSHILVWFKSRWTAYIPWSPDKLLLIVSMGFNVLTVWYAWKWV